MWSGVGWLVTLAVWRLPLPGRHRYDPGLSIQSSHSRTTRAPARRTPARRATIPRDAYPPISPGGRPCPGTPGRVVREPSRRSSSAPSRPSPRAGERLRAEPSRRRSPGPRARSAPVLGASLVIRHRRLAVAGPSAAARAGPRGAGVTGAPRAGRRRLRLEARWALTTWLGSFGAPARPAPHLRRAGSRERPPCWAAGIPLDTPPPT